MNNKLWKRLSALTLAAVLALGIAGCGGQEETPEKAEAPVQEEPATAPETETAAQPEHRVVIDALGREVEIPETLDRLAITCNGGAHQELTILGAGDRIVAMPSTKRFNQLEKMFPEYKEIVDAGAFDDVNIEEMVKADPDFIFVGQSAKEGNAKLEEAGFPVYNMLIGWADVESLKQEFLNVGMILGEEERAQELVDYWNEKIAMVEEAVSAVPEDERKLVYYCGSEITKANSSGWTWPLIETSGGISALPRGSKGEQNLEDILKWDPDVIITQGGKNSRESLMADERILSMTAIADGEVYECPIGAFWWDRPSPESPLAFMWLARTLYPDYTEDIDLKAETLDFFRQFYGYELTDEEYDSFFFQ